MHRVTTSGYVHLVAVGRSKPRVDVLMLTDVGRKSPAASVVPMFLILRGGAMGVTKGWHMGWSPLGFIASNGDFRGSRLFNVV